MEKVKPKNNTSKHKDQDPDYVCIYDLHHGDHPTKWKVNNRCKPENCPWLRTREEFKNVNIHFIGD